jgi:hypothetical protein
LRRAGSGCPGRQVRERDFHDDDDGEIRVHIHTELGSRRARLRGKSGKRADARLPKGLLCSTHLEGGTPAHLGTLGP